jgi:hypothetical protein
MPVLQLSYKIIQQSVGLSEKFTDREEDVKFLAVFITFLLWIAILLIVSKWLWNDVLCNMVSFTKQVTSVFQILGLVILLELLAPMTN